MNTLSGESRDILSLYSVGVSLLGLCIVAILTFNLPIGVVELSWQRQFTNSIFGAICILGILAGVSPSGCSRIIHFRRTRHQSSHRTKQTGTGEKTTRFEGHHPACGNFSSHVFHLSSGTYCTGCTGLVMGAAISLAGSLFYGFGSIRVGEKGIFFFWVGLAAVACGLVQYNLSKLNRGVLHLFLNIVFVLGAFLLQVGVSEVNGDFALELYLLTLTVYRIMTRTMLSQREHKKICAVCGLKPCSYYLNY